MLRLIMAMVVAVVYFGLTCVIMIGSMFSIGNALTPEIGCGIAFFITGAWLYISKGCVCDMLDSCFDRIV